MRKSKLSDSEKLMVFFGGMNLVGRKLQEIETAPEEDALTSFEIMKKAAKDLRVQFVDMLNRSGEVKYILDMFRKPPGFVFFNPVVFGMHLPISLQKVGYRMEPDHAEVEDFLLVYDGLFVMVSAVCSLEERPWAVLDLRDRLVTMIKTIDSNFEDTPPCLSHEAIVFVNKPKEVRKDPRDTYLEIKPKEKLVDALRNLYMRLSPGLTAFYSACQTSQAVNEVVLEIHENQTKLLATLKEFLATTWNHPLKRMRIVEQMKMYAIKILESMSKYSSLTRELKDCLSNIVEHRAHNDLFNNLIGKSNLDRYMKPESVDPESLIKIIEHTRSETETYGSFISTLVSTLVGAIIGSALTISISYCFGLL